MVSAERKLIADTALDIFGGLAKVWTYADESNESKIDILSCLNRPYNNISSFSTVGLSEYPNGFTLDNSELRIEIAGACETRIEYFPNIISTCAFNIINSKFRCFPNAIFQSVVEMYYPSTQMKHALFITPFVWDKEFPKLIFPDRMVTWLLVIPISENEFRYSKTTSVDDLLTVYLDKQINIFNIFRDSVI